MSREPFGRSRPSRVLAAGAVLWRPSVQDPEEPEIAVIHRPRYDDWSLPKGKLEPGEVEAVAAVREIKEETGFHGELERRLASVSYPVDEKVKNVQYWSARAVRGEFVPNNEVDKMLWLPLAVAMTKVSYAYDRKVLRCFAKQPADTHQLLIVRHATAGRRSRYNGDDWNRPLDRYGRAQAESLVGLLMAFGATDLHAADRLRCHQTIEPLAEKLSVSICNEPALTEEAYADSRKRARLRVLEIAEKPGTRVICSQGKVIPDLIEWWCEQDGVRPDRSRNRKGSVWVMSFADDKLISAHHIGSPLANGQ